MHNYTCIFLFITNIIIQLVFKYWKGKFKPYPGIITLKTRYNIKFHTYPTARAIFDAEVGVERK